MKKVVLLPLDERPCNYIFPTKLYGANYRFSVPEMSIMGDKKKPADYERLREFLLTETLNADGAVIAVDTLLYGGIVPSRMHHLTSEEIAERLSVLETIKKNNPSIKLYAFHLIMRCPSYSLSDEEPDYYQQFGYEIFLKGEVLHKLSAGIITQAEADEKLKELDAKINAPDYEDYMSRRAKNTDANIKSLELLERGIIDFLIIPQDDSAVYGHTALDQIKVRSVIKKLRLQPKALMYPGADEIALTLLARLTNDLKGKQLKAYVVYSSISGHFCIPSYEDRPLGETIKYQLLANGCIAWNNPDTADLILMINSPPGLMLEASQMGESITYDTQRTIIDFCEQARLFISQKKPTIIADVAYANGGDLELIHIFENMKLWDKVAAYAGWNTSSNTLGTAISQGVCYYHFGATKDHYDFLALRFVEDFGYCAGIRRLVMDKYLPGMGLGYFTSGDKRGKVAELVKLELENFIRANFFVSGDRIKIRDCWMPWARMFEVGLDVEYIMP